MAQYRSNLPQRSGALFLTDGGLETTLLFHKGLELPGFASFPLVESDTGLEAMRRYYARHAAIARANGFGFILESPTWRASADWGRKLGYADAALADLNRKAVAFMASLREAWETPRSPMVVSACVGPRGDGYQPGSTMTAEEAEAYHAAQIGVFRDTQADMVTAMTLNYAEEAIGVARAAVRAGMPVAISFTLETDGRLPTGQTLADAVTVVDAATGQAPAYYMINCAHPVHIAPALADGGPWLSRLRGLRANASKRSHAELDAAPDLDAGDPAELGRAYRDFLQRLPHINVLGGCCGTDHRHVREICRCCAPLLRGDRPRCDAA